MAAKDILVHRKLRRNFVWGVLLTLVFILLMRFFAIPAIWQHCGETLTSEPQWATILGKVLDSLFASLSVTLCVAAYLNYFELPKEEKAYDLVEPFRIKEYFERARNEATNWSFCGGAGRYTRSNTLPDLSRLSRQYNRTTYLSLSFIDPRDEALCERYANFRKSLRSADGHKDAWTKRYVQTETLASIVFAGIVRSTNNLMKIEVGFRKNFSVIRYDISDDLAIITKEDAREPAIVAAKGTYMYRTFKEDCIQAQDQCSVLNLPATEATSVESITEAQVTSFLSQIEGLTVDADMAKGIVDALKRKESPYA
jgi:hypothetical protein